MDNGIPHGDGREVPLVVTAAVTPVDHVHAVCLDDAKVTPMPSLLCSSAAIPFSNSPDLIERKKDSAASPARERLHAVWDTIFTLPVYQNLPMDEEMKSAVFHFKRSGRFSLARSHRATRRMGAPLMRKVCPVRFSKKSRNAPAFSPNASFGTIYPPYRSRNR